MSLHSNDNQAADAEPVHAGYDYSQLPWKYDPETFDAGAALRDALTTGINPHPVDALQIETSSICNFRCNSCVLSKPEYDRPAKHLGADEFRKILEAFPTVKKVELQGVGEVFLNPAVFEHIRNAVERGIEVHTFSNASKITREVAHGIVESGLAQINLSMDGVDEPTFRTLRKGGTLARYRRCVQNLLQARAALGSATPRVGIMTVLSKANYLQAPQMLAVAEELGVDRITFTKLNPSAKEDQEPLTLGPEELNWLRALPPYNGPMDVVWGFESMTLEERKECHWPRYMAYVTVEGDVTPCCNYFDSRELKMGNAFEQDWTQIWNDEPYRKFRMQLLNGNLQGYCKTC